MQRNRVAFGPKLYLLEEASRFLDCSGPSHRRISKGRLDAHYGLLLPASLIFTPLVNDTLLIHILVKALTCVLQLHSLLKLHRGLHSSPRTLIRPHPCSCPPHRRLVLPLLRATLCQICLKFLIISVIIRPGPLGLSRSLPDLLSAVAALHFSYILVLS